MAGVFGYASQHASIHPLDIAAAMGEQMRHRPHFQIDAAPAGPSGAMGRIGLGLMNPQPQPRTSTDGQVVITLCGEFYYQEQARRALERAGELSPEADEADYALCVYLGGGVDALAALEGMFVVAVWDDRTGDLWLVNDRFGLYPHYYVHWGSAFAFAPEMKALLAAPGLPRHLDMVAVAQYTRFQQLLGERTWFEDVHLLPPATVLRYRVADDMLLLQRYWDWDQIPTQPDDMTLDEAAEETIRLFERAIVARTQPPLRAGIFLSGGLDGRAILGVARDHVPTSTVTFGAPECRDVLIAKRIARRAGSDHYWVPFHDGRWVLEHGEEHLQLTEGQHSWMHAHGMSALPVAREVMDVNLSGWDGGTILGAFTANPGDDARFRHAPNEATLVSRLFDAFCAEYTWPGLTDEEAGRLYRAPLSLGLDTLARESFASEVARTAHYPPPYRSDMFYILQHCRRSTQNMVVFTRSAIEVRCPYFDYDLVSFLFGLPERLRSSLDLQHRVLTKRMPGLARIPNEKTNLPPHSSQALRLTHRAANKLRRSVNRLAPIFPDHPRLYADYENNLRHELADWGQQILFSPSTLERGLFNPDTVRALWEQHQRGDHLWTIGKVAPLMTLELVLRRFFDTAPASAAAQPTAALIH